MLFICSTYLFTYSKDLFLYKPCLSCKQGSGALIFIMHGIALLYFMNLAVFNVSRLSTHPLGDVLLLTFPFVYVGF
jgi:hypothetical protein